MNVTDLSSAIFANYISAPNAVIRKPLLGVAYNGTTFKLSVGDQMFFKFNVNPTTTGLNLDVDDKEINGGFTYIMAYKTYADINDFLPTPVLDTEGVRMYGLTAHKVGSFTFRLALVQFSTYNGNWDGY